MKYWITISLATIMLAGGTIAAEPAKPKPPTVAEEPFTYANVM